MMKLEIKNLKKSYGNKRALVDFSYTFSSGIYGILGANGAGKSTLMNLIADNLKRDGGSILFEGSDIIKLGAAFRARRPKSAHSHHADTDWNAPTTQSRSVCPSLPHSLRFQFLTGSELAPNGE